MGSAVLPPRVLARRSELNPDPSCLMQGGGVLDPAANLKVCDFKSGDVDVSGFLDKTAGGKSKKTSRTNPKTTDPEKAKRASSLQAYSACKE